MNDEDGCCESVEEYVEVKTNKQFKSDVDLDSLNQDSSEVKRKKKTHLIDSIAEQKKFQEEEGYSESDEAVSTSNKSQIG